MKKFFVIALLCLAAVTVRAQDDELFLVYELMKVEEGSYQAYMETEEFWAGIHKQRILSGSIIGWDLWSLQPSGTEQGFQFATVNLYSSMEAMFSDGSFDDLIATAKKAYPDMEEEAIMEKLNATGPSRDLAVRVYMHEIAGTTGGPDMEEGMVATFDYMMAKSSDYEKVEQEIFQPWHQESVDAEEKSSWGLLRVVLPMGSDRYFSHMTVNFYKDIAQYIAGYEARGNHDMGMIETMGVQHALKTRDMKSVHLARLIKMVR